MTVIDSLSLNAHSTVYVYLEICVYVFKIHVHVLPELFVHH